MDVHIEEVSSTVRVADSQMLLDPRVVERLTRILIGKVKDAMDRETRRKEERETPARDSREDF
jgi:hypothetical protein